MSYLPQTAASLKVDEKSKVSLIFGNYNQCLIRLNISSKYIDSGFNSSETMSH